MLTTIKNDNLNPSQSLPKQVLDLWLKTTSLGLKNIYTHFNFHIFNQGFYFLYFRISVCNTKQGIKGSW